jgi:hypothetical protein
VVVTDLTPESLAEYVREHRCYAARSDVSIADWDRGVAAIEAAAIARDREGLVEVVARGLLIENSHDARAWWRVDDVGFRARTEAARRLLELDAPEAQS